MSNTVDTTHEPDELSNEAEIGSVDKIAAYGVFAGVGVAAAVFSAVGAPQSMAGVGLGMILFGLSSYGLGKSAGWDDE